MYHADIVSNSRRLGELESGLKSLRKRLWKKGGLEQTAVLGRYRTAFTKLSSALEQYTTGVDKIHLGERKQITERVSVIDVLRMGDRRDDHAGVFGHCDRRLATDLILFVLLAFGHAVDLRLMQGLELVAILGLLFEHALAEFEVGSLGRGFISRQLALQLPDQTTGNGV